MQDLLPSVLFYNRSLWTTVKTQILLLFTKNIFFCLLIKMVPCLYSTLFYAKWAEVSNL